MSIETNVASEALSSVLSPQTAPKDPTTEAAEELNDVSEALPLVEEVESELEAKPLEKEQLETVVQQLQDFVQTLNRGIAFRVDQDSGKDVITVTNRDTGELVRQIPSEEVLLLASRLSEATGLLVNTKA